MDVRYLSFLFPVILCIMTSCNHAQTENEVIDDDTNDSIEIKVGIKMVREQGVYKIPCSVNGVSMDFIFDTGASAVCISNKEASFLLKNGYLNDSDFGGLVSVTVADGRVVESQELNLRSLEISGLIETDVKAYVTQNMESPLLLGQTAIRKLGKYQIEGDSLFLFRTVYKPSKNIAISGNKKEVIKEESIWGKLTDIFINNHKNDKRDEYINSASDAWIRGMNELAQDYCEKAIQEDTTYWVPFALKGFLLFGENKYDSFQEAQLCLQNAAQLNTNEEFYVFQNGKSISSEDVKYYLGRTYLKNRLYKDAIIVSQKILERNPECIKAMDVIVLSFAEERDYWKAEEWAKRMLETHIADAYSYFRIGYLNQVYKDSYDAVKYYEKSIELSPNNYSAINNLAMIYYKYNKPLAITMMRKAANLGCAKSKEWLEEQPYCNFDSRNLENLWYQVFYE